MPRYIPIFYIPLILIVYVIHLLSVGLWMRPCWLLRRRLPQGWGKVYRRMLDSEGISKSNSQWLISMHIMIYVILPNKFIVHTINLLHSHVNIDVCIYEHLWSRMKGFSMLPPYVMRGYIYLLLTIRGCPLHICFMLLKCWALARSWINPPVWRSPPKTSTLQLGSMKQICNGQSRIVHNK